MAIYTMELVKHMALCRAYRKEQYMSKSNTVQASSIGRQFFVLQRAEGKHRAQSIALLCSLALLIVFGIFAHSVQHSEHYGWTTITLTILLVILMLCIFLTKRCEEVVDRERITIERVLEATVRDNYDVHAVDLLFDWMTENPNRILRQVRFAVHSGFIMGSHVVIMQYDMDYDTLLQVASDSVQLDVIQGSIVDRIRN